VQGGGSAARRAELRRCGDGTDRADAARRRRGGATTSAAQRLGDAAAAAEAGGGGARPGGVHLRRLRVRGDAQRWWWSTRPATRGCGRRPRPKRRWNRRAWRGEAGKPGGELALPEAEKEAGEGVGPGSGGTKQASTRPAEPSGGGKGRASRDSC
jgi:hypothetical protein